MKRGFAIRLPFRLETQGLLCTAVLGAVGFVVLYPLLLLILCACIPTLQIYTETPDKELLLKEAGKTIGVKAKVVEAPGKGVVNFEFRPNEGQVCGEALEKVVGADSLRDALKNGVIDCEPKAWSCDNATFAAHELAHTVGLLKHTEAGLMAPSPEDGAQLTDEQKLQVRVLTIGFNEVCR